MCLESSLIHPEDQISPGTHTQDTFDPDKVNPDRVNPDMEIKSVCEVFTQTCTQEYELQITNLTKVRKSIPPPTTCTTPNRLTHFITRGYGDYSHSKLSRFPH